jgi:carboxyl-terminal processing protease
MEAKSRKSNDKRWLFPLLSIIVTILVFVIGYVIGRAGFTAAWENGEVNYSFKGDLYPEEKDINFDLFWEVWNKLETEYVDKDLDEEDMFYGAIHGLVSSLDDPATSFFTPEETNEYEISKAGIFEGIGIEMGYLDNKIVVKKIFDDSPASRSDLQKGDFIVGVDGEDMREASVGEAAINIRGQAGTTVVLTVERGEDEIDVSIQRGEVYVESIEWKMIEGDIAFVTVRRFTEDSLTSFTSLWDQVIYEIEAENPKSMIIDLRGNGGGYIDGATYLAGEFLDEGQVVLYIKNREGKLQVQKVNRKGRFTSIDLVLLVDEGTASAAEIFAGALQHYDRATVVGTQTYGKGTAQDVEKPVTWGGASIHITTQKWLLPDKRWINHDDPVYPDTEVKVNSEQLRKGEDSQLEEAKRLL